MLPAVEVYVGMTDASLDVLTTKLVTELRRSGDFGRKGHRGALGQSQMKYADKLGAHYALIVGQNEVDTGRVTVKDMQKGESFEAGAGRAEGGPVGALTAGRRGRKHRRDAGRRQPRCGPAPV